MSNSVLFKRRQSIEGKLKKKNIIIDKAAGSITFTEAFYLNIAQHKKNYLIKIEKDSVFSLDTSKEEPSVLFFEINPISGDVELKQTFSLGFLSNPYGMAYPQTAESGDIFFSLKDFTLRQWNGMAWVKKIGIVLGKLYIDGSMDLYTNRSQANINIDTLSSKVVKTRDLDTIILESNNGIELLTYEDLKDTGTRNISSVSYHNRLVKCISDGTISKYDVVSRDSNYRITRASIESDKEGCGIVLNDADIEDDVIVLEQGYIYNKEWAWTDPPTTALYFDGNGELTTVSPLNNIKNSFKFVQKIGYIVDPQTIFFLPEQRFIL